MDNMDAISELRQRRKEEEDTPNVASRSFSKRLEKLDIYPKIGDDYVIKTEGGGYELRQYLTEYTVDTITIDHTLNEKLIVNFNLSVYEITCDKASIDVMDISGQQQMGVTKRLVKIDLNNERKPVNMAMASVLEEVKNFNSTCGDCYGAAIISTCCNTCDDLKNAYLSRRWDTWFIEKYSPQCRIDNKEVLVDSQTPQGCMLWGQLEINKVAGNFHIAVGHAENRDSRHLHSFGPGQVMNFNASHHIERLSFGEYSSGMKNPLDQMEKTADSVLSYTYYMRIVPTVYESLLMRTMSDEYSVYEVPRKVEMTAFGQITTLPGIFFIYDFSPFMHIISKHSMSLAHFLVRVCAVVGGVAAIAKLMDTVMYYRIKV